MKIITDRCDNCGKDRDKDTNHWSAILGYKMDGVSPSVWTGGVKAYPPSYPVGTSMRGVAADACGDVCRFALMSRFLATGSFSRTAVGAK